MKNFAEQNKYALKDEIIQKNLHPVLAVVQVGANPASNSYIKGKLSDCKEIGIEGRHIKLNEDVTQTALDNTLMFLGADPHVHGIIVQLPIPKHLQVKTELIESYKDVDGFRPDSLFIPCTALGISLYLNERGVNLAGKNVVIIGRSKIVGKPMAKLLLDENATVTVCHSYTKDIAIYTKTADIIIVATGQRNLLTRDMIGENKPIVIDVGINRNEEGKLCGDCDYANIIDICEYVSPVPGGVGLLTRMALMANVVKAAELQR
ncbi:MAG: bifunctional 5,10-methylenetetrahydrofolate dehydrogenase/5,10-methenyltetrahydrofolate cyclohydrolase [Agathobacter sp.]|nr:bifunctional 5,10-methylenetetrahydrofolate dehydrogenase/5,10-methenyltetrahydrofolate cyclohydrolase [Agathobacter sp.]